MEERDVVSSSQIMRVAERLFAEKGLDSVSLGDIASIAGIENPHTVSVRFGKKVHLIDAVIERHATDIQAQWWEAIESLTRRDAVTVRSLIEVMVFPTMQKLYDPDGGRAYVAIAAQIISHPVYRWHDRPIAMEPGGARLFFELGQLVKIPPQLMPLRIQRVVSAMYRSISEYADLDFVVPPDVFAADLIDTLTALISAPVSGNTRDTMDDNDF